MANENLLMSMLAGVEAKTSEDRRKNLIEEKKAGPRSEARILLLPLVDELVFIIYGLQAGVNRTECCASRKIPVSSTKANRGGI